MKEYTPKQRTDQQRKAIEVFCHLLAESLNDAGKDQRVVLKPSISIPWTQEAVKSQLFKPIMKALFNYDSTTQLKKNEGEIDKVHEVLMRELGLAFHIEYIDFPSEDKDNLNTSHKLYKK